MPIKIPDGLPAKQILINEEVIVITESTALLQDIRPLKIILLNLMPDKIVTETQIARVLGATPLQIELTLLRTSSYMGKNTPEDHLLGFYQTFDEIEREFFDGIIVTGAPVEQMEFEAVDYWAELQKIFEWSNKNVFSKFFICWGAQAALYHFYGHKKIETPQKQFGVFAHERLDFKHALTRGFDDFVNIPVSRHTRMDDEELRNNKNLKIILNAAETGAALVTDDAARRIFMFNHLEYDRETLQKEYERDRAKGLDIQLPQNYFPNNNPDLKPQMNWRAHRNLLFNNWVNMVYQATPFDLKNGF